MKAAYWDNLAKTFSTEVLEITENDLDGVIAKAAARLGGRTKTAIDFGCGAGASTRGVAPFFGRVVGLDFSSKLLSAARRKCGAGNISYRKADLASLAPGTYGCDAGFCFNVLLSPDAKLRRTIAENVIGNIASGGAAIFVAPSMESWMRTYQAALKARVAQGFSAKTAAREIDGWFATDVRSLSQGIVDQGGAMTKHYFEDELRDELSACGLRRINISKVRFPWREVLDDLPDDFDAAPPFDWMATGRVS